MAERFSIDGYFWRKLAMQGAANGPRWLFRYSPRWVGLAAMVCVPKARRAVIRNLERARGKANAVRTAQQVAETFANYAASLAEALAAGSKNGLTFKSHTVDGRKTMYDAIELGKGVVVTSVHSGGWDILGSVFADRMSPEFTIVMEPERDEGARRFHDEVREKAGVKIAHVGDDPMAALPLLRTLRNKGIVAILCDRTPQGMKTFDVTLFGKPGKMPQGPFRLAQLSGAPIVPLFCVRCAFQSYHVIVGDMIFVSKRGGDAEAAEAAQRVADHVTAFVQAFPTQWFNFAPDEAAGV